TAWSGCTARATAPLSTAGDGIAPRGGFGSDAFPGDATIRPERTVPFHPRRPGQTPPTDRRGRGRHTSAARPTSVRRPAVLRPVPAIGPRARPSPPARTRRGTSFAARRRYREPRGLHVPRPRAIR